MEPRVIIIPDDEKNSIYVRQGELVKLIKPDGENIGLFHIMGKLLAGLDEAGTVVLVDVPHQEEEIVIDVNHDAGQMTYISNATFKHHFKVNHKDITEEDSLFRPLNDAIVSPRPFTVTFGFYSVDEDADKTVTIKFRPLPAEHALQMEYTIS